MRKKKTSTAVDSKHRNKDACSGFVPKAVPSAPVPNLRFAEILRPGLSAEEGVSRLLRLYGGMFRAAHKGILTRNHPDDLHDLRVVMRRFRSALRLYGKRWPTETASEIEKTIAGFSDTLSPVRDAQVWRQFLEKPGVRAVASQDRKWKSYLRNVGNSTGRRLAELKRIVGGPEWMKFLVTMDRFLRVELPSLEAHPAGESLEALLSRKVEKVYGLILKHERNFKEMDPEEFHELRRLVRRGRYWAEFLAPVAGPAGRRLAVQLKEGADALGEMHDLDVGQRILAGSGVSLPRLRRRISSRRVKCLAAFKKISKRFWNDGFRKRVMQELRKLQQNPQIGKEA